MNKGDKIVKINEYDSEDIKSYKKLISELINNIDSNSHLDSRLSAITITKLEEACMFGTKLLSYGK